MTTGQCHYQGKNGEHCHHDAEIEGFCYWHDRSKKKNEPDLIERLEKRARTGEAMVGFCLQGSCLRGIDLVNHNKKIGYQLLDSDLYHCDLRDAHLFHIDFSGSSLMKANLDHANLNCATLKDVNLLGTQLQNTKMDNVDWGEKILQEIQADQSNEKSEKWDLFEQSEEIYRNLRRVTESQGLFELSGHFFQREMVMRRYQLPRYDSKRILSKLVDLFCGYGEDPSRVVIFSLLTIFSFAFLYFFFGITDGSTNIVFALEYSWLENLKNLLNSLYFSVVTFTTLGYGDLAPAEWTRAFAAIEAFIGSFTLALFVVVFVKKMTR